MLESREEYQRMYDVERSLWWYRTLHARVLKVLERNFRSRDITLLDAACGTGGLLSFLKENGYSHLKGFDYSEFAVEFSRSRNLDVNPGDLRNVGGVLSGTLFDAVVCNDALYFLSDAEIVNALSDFRKRLNKGGVVIINIHAFEAFAGTHDLAVGSRRRFRLADFKEYAAAAGLTIQQHSYWPFLLSFPILLVRQWQQFRIRKGKVNVETVDSDVSYPGDFLNGILSGVMKTEEALLPVRPFGSSLFLVLK